MKYYKLLLTSILLFLCFVSIAQKNSVIKYYRDGRQAIALGASNGQIQNNLPGSQFQRHLLSGNNKIISENLNNNRISMPRLPGKTNMVHNSISSDINAIFKEKLDSLAHYYWNGEYWELDRIERYRYDISGIMVEYEEEYWGEGNSLNKETWKYDPDGKVISVTTSYWDDNFSKWMFDIKTDYKYDSNGNLVLQVEYYYDSNLLIWLNSYKYEYAYDVNNNQILFYSYNWNNDSLNWIESNKAEIYYNENNLEISYFYYNWDGYNWILAQKNETQYDERGNDTLTVTYSWNGEGWDPSTKFAYSYNAGNRMIQYIYSYWDSYTTFNWLQSSKEDYTYDTKGNLIDIYYYYWDTYSSTWYESERYEYIFDLSVNEDNLALPVYWDENPSKMSGSFDYYWNGEMKTWDTTGKSDIYYSDFLATPSDQVCQAAFTPRIDTINPYLIHFLNLSAADVSSWYWDFGDGTTSSLNNPSHQYKSDGIYIATLSTKDLTGFCTSSLSQRIIIGIPSCNAYFYPFIDTLTRIISFMNASDGTDLIYHWTFGDGTVSSLQYPVHEYIKSGVYDVSLIVMNSAGTCMDEYIMRVPLTYAGCNADFTVFVDSTYNMAYFNSIAQNSENQYYWIFGDGGSSTISNPVHRFSQPGYYSAMLSVSNKKLGCIDSHKETVLIGSTGIDSKADFIYTVDESTNVIFFDKSSVAAEAYFWNFGDGGFSKFRNPSHMYSEPGYYNVCLTIYPNYGIQNITCKKILVAKEETGRCLAQFNYLVNDSDLTVSCFDASYGTPDSWLWKFNDGWSSTLQNPVYIAKKAGYYLTHLQIQNSSNGCEDDAFGLVNVSNDKVLKAAFGFIKRYTGLKADSYPVDLIGVSYGEGSKLKWNFGDGTYDSTTTTPTHVYTAPGAYNVCYTVTDQVTNVSDTYCQIIYVGISGLAPESVENAFQLSCYPNPFSKLCNITFTVIEKGLVEVTLYDPDGRKVADIDRSNREPGRYELEFDGAGFDSGIYYLLLRTRNGYATSLLNIIK